jgi:mannose-6-phosphate isomerase
VQPAVRLTPSFRERVWGRKSLAPYFPDQEKATGEVWFLAAERLPLLVKFLYTSERLSVQVHPDDGDEGEGVPGKTEMWHVLEAAPGAAVGLGFRETITRERLREAALSGEIERLLDWKPVRAGETYFVPAHTVHAVGAGLVLCEIQQNTDVTYRLYDYGRPRELHLEQAIPLCDLGPHPGRTSGAVRSRHFVTEAVELEGGEALDAPPRNCQMWIVLEGQGAIGGQPFQAGEVWLLPPEATRVQATTPARFLRTWAPETPSA